MIELVKLHGLGNDFLVCLDPAAVNPALAREVCHRRRGIGADGLVAGGLTAGGELTFRLWNADGSEAEMSGNGLRCLAHAALDADWVEAGRPFDALTPAGKRSVVIRRTDPGCTWAVVGMGPVTVSPAGEALCNVGHGAARVDVGNPHLVLLGPDPASLDVGRLGPDLERSEPAGLNVEFVSLGPGPDTATMRVWERGVGETQACGTGSVAAAAALHHWGRVGPAVTVRQPGGDAAVELRPDGTATLAGPSVRVARCYWESAA
jgi:diaminopimelate epimerase